MRERERRLSSGLKNTRGIMGREYQYSVKDVINNNMGQFFYPGQINGQIIKFPLFYSHCLASNIVPYKYILDTCTQNSPFIIILTILLSTSAMTQPKTLRIQKIEMVTKCKNIIYIHSKYKHMQHPPPDPYHPYIYHSL